MRRDKKNNFKRCYLFILLAGNTVLFRARFPWPALKYLPNKTNTPGFNLGVFICTVLLCCFCSVQAEENTKRSDLHLGLSVVSDGTPLIFHRTVPSVAVDYQPVFVGTRDFAVRFSFGLTNIISYTYFAPAIGLIFDFGDPAGFRLGYTNVSESLGFNQDKNIRGWSGINMEVTISKRVSAGIIIMHLDDINREDSNFVGVITSLYY